MDKTKTKPRIGLLALMLEAYETIFPGICKRQARYLSEVLAALEEHIQPVCPKIALNRSDIAELVASYNAQKLDGILVLFLSYAQGQYLAHALRDNRLPLALCLIQPEQSVGDAFDELALTVNQGIHGAQDNAYSLLRAGLPYVSYAGNRHSASFTHFVKDFAEVAACAQALKQMKICVIGRLAGMGDIITDEWAIQRKFGCLFEYESIGSVYRLYRELAPTDIEARRTFEKTVFDIDPALPEETHGEAIRLYLAIKALLESKDYAAYSIHFEEFGADGRFSQLPLLAASNLLADGYGYAAEGDGLTALLCALTQKLCGPASFSEMYMMDFARDALLFCHAGEGNWALARKDKKPFLMDRVFNEGGLSNPPTLLFTPEPGEAAVLSLVYLGGEHFRLLYAGGTILDKNDLRHCEMPYLFFRPHCGLESCAQAWLEKGGPHHEAIVLGDPRARIELLCRLLAIEFCPLD